MSDTTPTAAKPRHRILKTLAALIGAIIVVVVAYVIYVMVSYYRLPDNLELPTEPPQEGTAIAQIDAESGELVAVSANLGFGAYGPDFDFFMDGGSGSVAASAQYAQDNVEGSAQAILGTDPDFILFQEVDIQGTRAHNLDEYRLLRQTLPHYCSVFAQNYDSPYLAWPPYAPHGANKAGLATFSEYGIADGSLRRSLPISDSFSKFLDLDRCYAITRIPVSNGKSLVLFNVHLSAYGADESIMAGQRSLLYEDMKRELAADNYCIAGGDFNHDMIGVSNEVYGNATATEASWAKPFDFDGVPEGFTVAAKTELDAGKTSAATCRDAGRPYDGTNDRWVMDTFIYSSNVESVSCETLDLDFAYSDHNPVVFRFHLA